jgi:hypothetical protein
MPPVDWSPTPPLLKHHILALVIFTIGASAMWLGVFALTGI